MKGRAPIAPVGSPEPSIQEQENTRRKGKDHCTAGL